MREKSQQLSENDFKHYTAKAAGVGMSDRSFPPAVLRLIIAMKRR